MKYSNGSANPSFTLMVKMLAFAICLSMFNGLRASAGEKISKAKIITKFPFKLVEGGIIVLQAKIGNLPDALNFILDTGCGGISLDSLTAGQLKLPLTYSNKTIKGIAELKQVTFVMNQALNLPNLLVEGLNFHLNDYGFLYESYGIPIHGIIGYALLKKFIVKVNYETRIIEVWNPGEIKYPRNGALLPMSIEMLPVFNASIKDNRAVEMSYIFDTGADICFLMSNTFARDSNILYTDKKKLLVQAEGLGGPCAMTFTTVNEMKVGPYTFKKVPSYIFEDKYNVTKYPACGGVIGNALLHRFNLIINYAEAEIHLSPNAYFKDPFDYNYTGFRIFSVNGKVTIENVIEDSPAGKAGLMDGDIVLGVNNNFSDRLDDYKNIICSTRDTLRLSIIRNNQLKTIVVAVESVLY